MMSEETTVQEKLVGGELYHAIHRLLAEWRDRDAAEQTQMLPQLVKQLAQLAEGYGTPIARLVAHDQAEAA